MNDVKKYKWLNSIDDIKSFNYTWLYEEPSLGRETKFSGEPSNIGCFIPNFNKTKRINKEARMKMGCESWRFHSKMYIQYRDDNET